MRHHDHGNSNKRKHVIVVAYRSKIQSIAIMVERGSVQADMVLERELRVLHLAPAAGSGLKHWVVS